MTRQDAIRALAIAISREVRAKDGKIDVISVLGHIERQEAAINALILLLVEKGVFTQEEFQSAEVMALSQQAEIREPVLVGRG